MRALPRPPVPDSAATHQALTPSQRYKRPKQRETNYAHTHDSLHTAPPQVRCSWSHTPLFASLNSDTENLPQPLRTHFPFSCHTQKAARTTHLQNQPHTVTQNRSFFPQDYLTSLLQNITSLKNATLNKPSNSNQKKKKTTRPHTHTSSPPTHNTAKIIRQPGRPHHRTPAHSGHQPAPQPSIKSSKRNKTKDYQIITPHHTHHHTPRPTQPHTGHTTHSLGARHTRRGLHFRPKIQTTTTACSKNYTNKTRNVHRDTHTHYRSSSLFITGPPTPPVFVSRFRRSRASPLLLSLRSSLLAPSLVPRPWVPFFWFAGRVVPVSSLLSGLCHLPAALFLHSLVR